MTLYCQHNMHDTYFVLATLLFAIHNAHALTPVNLSPTSTAANNGLQRHFAPQPTAPPRGFELRIRQQSAIATCGFIDGASASAVTCGSGLNCAATGTYVGCCDVADCRDIFTSCYDLLGSPCDQACQANVQNLVCPTSLQYCAEYQYEGGSTGLGCAAIQGYTKTVLLTSVTGDATILTTPSPSTTTTTPPVSSSPPPTPAPSSSLSTGATAGIGVGVALGVIAVAIVGFIFYRRRKKAKKHEVAAVATTTAETSQVNKPQPGPDRESKALSELHAFPRSPTSPTSAFNAPQPSPGLPVYSQHYDGQVVEMPDNPRPLSYATTSELGSSRM